MKEYSINLELNNKDKNLFPKNLKNLYHINFFKKKKSHLFFFKSEAKYKVKIVLKINNELLKKMFLENKSIPQIKELIYFYTIYINIRKQYNIQEIENNLFYELLNNNTNNNNNNNNNNINTNTKLFDNNLIDLGNNFYLNLTTKKFEINKINYKFIKGKIIFNDLYFNNKDLITQLINKCNMKKNNNLNLINNNLINSNILLVTNRKLYWQEQLKNENYLFIEKNNIEKNNIESKIFEDKKIVFIDLNLIEKNINYFINYYWHILVLDLDSSYINNKKDLNFLTNIKYQNKYLLINKFYLLENYNTTLNIFLKKYNNYLIDSNNLKGFIELNQNKINKNITIKNDFISFNPQERKKYKEYLDKFSSFYKQNNILFVDDIYLRKMCCFPEKNLKINIINFKDLSNEIDNFNIQESYKEKIISINKKKNECSICLNNIKSNNLCLTKCGHIYCFTCIHKSINYSHNCPSCRQDLKENDLYYIKTDNKKILDNKIINYGLLDNLGSKIKSLIKLIKTIDNVVIFSNYDECIKIISSIFKKLQITNSLLLNYDTNQINIKNYNNIVFLEPLYEKKKEILKMRYKFIYSLFEKKNINVYNLIINNSIEKQFFIQNNLLINQNT